MGCEQCEHVWIVEFCWFESERETMGTILVCIVDDCWSNMSDWDSSLGCINPTELLLLPRMNEWMNDKRIIHIHVLHSVILLLHLDFNLFSNYEMMIDGDCACIWMRWDEMKIFFFFSYLTHEHRRRTREKESPINTMIREQERKKKSLSE